MEPAAAFDGSGLPGHDPVEPVADHGDELCRPAPFLQLLPILITVLFILHPRHDFWVVDLEI